MSPSIEPGDAADKRLDRATRRRLATYVMQISGRFALQRAKDAIKILLGRAPFTSQLDGFVYRHWPHLLRLQAFRHLTVDNSCAGEGAGSRALMTMLVIGLARQYGLSYRHTPFAGIAHAVGDQQEWDRRWEAFFNLGADERWIARGEEAETFDYHLLTFLKTRTGKDLTQFVRPALPAIKPLYYTDFKGIEDDSLHACYAALWNECLGGVLPDLRARYRTANPRSGAKTFTVCIHIRRGDVNAERADMWTGNEAYARCYRVVADALEARGVAFECLLFSQGRREDFAEFARPETRFMLDADPHESLRAMTDADVLIMSKSCFSHVAALLGDAIPIYEPGAIPPLADWVERDGEGNPDAAALASRLDAALATAAASAATPGDRRG